MSAAPDPLAGPLTASALRALEDVLPAEVRADLEAELARPPSADEWRGALSLGLGLLGAALCGAAIVYAVAFNWQAMPPSTRLALPILGTAAAAVGARGLGLDRMGAQILLSLACVLVGASLLVYGQTYQTGADPWQLFAAWTALTAPWVVAARFAPLALAWVMLANVAFGLHWEAHTFLAVRLREAIGAALAMGVNLALLWLWERAGARLRAGEGRVGPRVLTLYALGPVTVASWWGVLESEGFWHMAPLSLAALVGGGALVGLRAAARPRDLFQLTVVALAWASTLGVAAARAVFYVMGVNPLTVFAMAGVALALAVGVASFLRTMHRGGGAP